MEKIVLGFGSNIGNRYHNIQSAVKLVALSEGFNLLALSSVYETEPWGFKHQNNFLNCCGVFLCRYNPAEALKILKSAEKSLGRLKRDKWQAREIDIDILFYGTRIIKNGKLVIPHPYIKERNFVLKPIVEIMPEFIHPVFNKSIQNLYNLSADRGKIKEFRKINE